VESSDLIAAADRLVDLACLTYGPDEAVERRRQAERLLDERPELAGASVHAAAVLGDVERLRGWLDANPALARARGGPRGWSALMYLCYARLDRGDAVAAARLLLERGADPREELAMFGCPWTALTGAMGEGEQGPVLQPPHPQAMALARLLLDAGANPNESQGLYNTHFLPSNHWLELLLSYGLRATDLTRFGPDDMPTLDYLLGNSVDQGRIDRVRLLLDHGASARARSWYSKRTVHQEAVLRGHLEIAELLLRHGAEPATLDPAQSLQAACMRADEAEARRLLAAHPGLTVTPEILGQAASQGRLPAVRLALSLGVPIDAIGAGGATALHMAAGAGHLEVVRELVERGASLSLRDLTYDGTPAGHAAYLGARWPSPEREELLKYLLDRAREPSS
jgi:ankyrin repeat protein